MALCEQLWVREDGVLVRDAMGRFILPDGLVRMARAPPLAAGGGCGGGGDGSAEAAAARRPEEVAREIMVFANQNLGILLYEEVSWNGRGHDVPAVEWHIRS